jgi:putative membrane-bound dehydrogenase-like protein
MQIHFKNRVNFWKIAIRLSCMPCVALATAAIADFPTVYNSEADSSANPPTPADSVAKPTLPPGFKATVFAAEPDVQNPIAMAWDSRGRLWIAENYTYAERTTRFDQHLRDRILIFEDINHDGHFDKRTVFTDDVQQLTSVEVGHGGVWALCPPQLLFFPDRNEDDVPDGPAQVKLDGFKIPMANYHNFANGLHWGPDGWLYGRAGASAPGEIGKPGTAEAERLPLRGGIWRYHARRQVAEVLTAGPVNAWGHDWNEHGELFCCNTVTGHLWHIFPGAHYVVTHTVDANQHVYQLIDMHADHWHFDVGQGWSKSRDGKANTYGGGHAHTGTMIYLGDNWPDAYRGKLYTLNYFGRRANQEILERSGSGYVGKHGEDCLQFGDGWFRGMDLGYGPDGGVYVLDWSDTGECHENTGVHRTSGRIYKITYGQPNPPTVGDLAKLGISDLVKLHLHKNEWYVRQARQQLAERATTGREFDQARTELHSLFNQQTDAVQQLRVLCSLYVIGGADETFLRAQLHHPDEHIRVWAIRLLSDTWPLDTVISERPMHATARINQDLIDEFVQVAKTDVSNLVHLALASTLQRLPVSKRMELAAPLVARSANAQDHNLPLLIWYGLIPVAKEDPASITKLAAGCQLPLTRQFIARCLGEEIESNPAPINALLTLALNKPSEFQNDIVTGLSEALRGWSKAKEPAAWDVLQIQADRSNDSRLSSRVRDLSILFGDGRALEEVTQVALDDKVELAQRQAALETLIANKSPDLRQICERLLTVRFLNTVAIRGLAQFDDPAIGEKLTASYPRFHALERDAVLDTLTSRPSFARSLLKQIADGEIPRRDVTPFYARRIRSFNDPELTAQLAEVWGQLRDSSADTRKQITSWKAKLKPALLASGDKSNGRAVFNKTCSVCHVLYGYGDHTGLDLTGSSRNNLDFLLDNIVDPSAVVNADFRMHVVVLNDGRTLNGVIVAKTDRTITLKSQTAATVVDRNDIDEMQESTLSLMPDGLLESLSETQVRDLIAYLMHSIQVPLNETPSLEPGK